MLGLLTDPTKTKGIPKPNRVVNSGRGFWGFWKLSKPQPVDGKVDGVDGPLTKAVESYGQGVEHVRPQRGRLPQHRAYRPAAWNGESKDRHAPACWTNSATTSRTHHGEFLGTSRPEDAAENGTVGSVEEALAKVSSRCAR